MSSLRELLDKQKDEKAAQIPPLEQPSTKIEPEPPKKRSVLDRIGNGSIIVTGNNPPPPIMKSISEDELKAVLDAGLNPNIMIELPAKQDLPQSSIEELRKNLDFLAENIDQKSGLVGQVVRTIGSQLYENPQFSSCMKDPDFDLLVRGLRRSFNIAARRRVEAGEKKEERREEVIELENMMKDLGVSLKF